MEAQVKRRELFRLALSFLTVLPVGKDIRWEEGNLLQASLFFPLLGLGLGFLVFLGWQLSLFLTRSPLFSAFLTVFLLVFLTRGLHLDGVADVCDAWVVEKGRKQEVLKDSRIGTFGALGIIFVLGTKVLLLAELRNSWYLLWVPFLGRVAVLELSVFFPPLDARSGLGKELLGRVPRWYFLCWALAGALGMWWWRGAVHLLKIGISFGIIYTLGKLLQKNFGGLNGDMLGMGVETGEILMLFWGRFWP